MSFLRKVKTNRKDGFTLIELLVAMSVFLVITALTLANYPKFNSQTAIAGLAQQVAISIREAQVYGVAVKNSSSTASAAAINVYPAYGIFFASPIANTTYGGETSYSVFFDRTTSTGPGPYFRPLGDDYFTDSAELVETVRIQNGNKIINICGVKVGENTCTDATAVNIVFRRPNPDAIIKIVTDPVTWPFTSPTLYECSRVDITLQSRDNSTTKKVQVYASGQVNIE
jgi:prepilin-type N-terminal cleavage/methylation domain-containing protein